MSNFPHKSNIKLSIRRVTQIGLPGDDPTLFNVKLGASLKGGSPLRGLSHDEEIKYMPDIIGYSPNDNDWRRATKDYWNNISVTIPADGATADELQGKILDFTIAFKTKEAQSQVESLLSFTEKAQELTRLDNQGLISLIYGVEDYVLFQFATKSSSVANTIKDIRKSPKISFYLYSKAVEVQAKYNLFKLRTEAKKVFLSLMEDESLVNALLVMFEQDVNSFADLPSKHLALEVYVDKYPQEFIKYTQDSTLKVKSFISKAVKSGIINKPSNSDNYYYGDNNDVLLGKNLEEAVLFLTDVEPKNQEIKSAISARLKNLT